MNKITQQPQIILLREGTEVSQGKGQLLSNITACIAVSDIVRTTLGPRGMDKLMVSKNGSVTISNDGATILKLLDVVHPAAKTLVDIACAQDAEVGDGTTSVTLLAGEMLRQVKPLVEDGISPQVIIRGFRRSCDMALLMLNDLAVPLDPKKDLKELLCNCAATALTSKIIHGHSLFFSKMVVDAVTMLDESDSLNESLIGIKRVPGGAVQDSFLVDGVAFKKSFSYAGFEQQPKKFNDVSILALNVELELKAERDNAEIRVDKVEEYQRIVDAEWQIIYDKLDKIVETGAKVVLSKLPIGDLATQYFADRDIFCAGRVTDEDMERLCKATKAQIQSSCSSISKSYLGSCKLFEEKQIGAERFNIFTGCPESKSVSIVLRGGAEQFIAEVERSLHDAIMIVRRAMKCKDIVAGGGAIEMELSKLIREQSKNIAGRLQLVVSAFAKSLEVIPRALCENAGFDPTEILNKLRQKHHTDTDGKWFGVDVMNETICDNMLKFVWEPSVVKYNCLSAATEAACVVLSVDETVKNPKSEQPGQEAMRGRGRGRF